jgi:hypothetical protein
LIVHGENDKGFTVDDARHWPGRERAAEGRDVPVLVDAHRVPVFQGW